MRRIGGFLESILLHGVPTDLGAKKMIVEGCVKGRPAGMKSQGRRSKRRRLARGGLNIFKYGTMGIC